MRKYTSFGSAYMRNIFANQVARPFHATFSFQWPHRMGANCCAVDKADDKTALPHSSIQENGVHPAHSEAIPIAAQAMGQPKKSLDPSEEELAATKLQSQFRGVQGRQIAHERKVEKLGYEEIKQDIDPDLVGIDPEMITLSSVPARDQEHIPIPTAEELKQFGVPARER